MSKQLTKEEFVEKARAIHGDRFVYSLVDYKGATVKVKIICREHGIFEQTPLCHLQGHGCSNCNPQRRLTTKEFIQKAKEIWGERYNYSLVEYVNSYKKVKIVCLEHGAFEIIAGQMLIKKRKECCPECIERNRLEQYKNREEPNREELKAEFLKKARAIHGYRYEYALVNYVNNVTPIIIGCPIHGKFEQRPENHLRGNGCPICGKYRRAWGINQLMKRLEI